MNITVEVEEVVLEKNENLTIHLVDEKCITVYADGRVEVWSPKDYLGTINIDAVLQMNTVLER